MRLSQGAPILFLPPHENRVYISVNAVSEYFVSQRVYHPSWSVCMYCVSDVFTTVKASCDLSLKVFETHLQS